MIQGSVFFARAGAVREPFLPACSNAQKKSVLLGCPARFTGMLPAKLRGSVPRPVMLGKFSVTSKSAVKPFQPESRVQRRSGLTALPFRTEVAFWLSRPRMRK